MEDEARMRRLLELILQKPGYQVQSAADGEAGIKLWKSFKPDLVLSDLKMPKMNGIDVLRFRNEYFPDTPFILLTAYGTVATAVKAMKEGAYDYLTKPVDNQQVLQLVAQALETVQIVNRSDARLIGSSSSMKKLRQDIALAAATDSSVLITGESGTGKELVARAIHEAYGGSHSPFIRVNCPAIPNNLFESELFGHLKGAFTGAVQNRRGAFVRADGGTLFLDEIGDLPLVLQPKLLHAVEQKSVTPVGGSQPQAVRVKIITATNLDLVDMVAQGTFRSDLFYRLNTLQIELPPLRHRPADIEPLARAFLSEFGHRFGRGDLILDEEVLQYFHQYHWPGNVRQLRHVIEQGVLKSRGTRLSANLLPEAVLSAISPEKKNKTGAASLDLQKKEREMIIQALRQCEWNKARAARQLNITRNTLRYRIKKYGITPAET